MNKALEKLPLLVAKELEAANVKFPPFRSLHEGYAVMLEEVEETREALIDVELHMKKLWQDVRFDNDYYVESHVSNISNYAQLVAAEAIQVAAMAKKMLAYIDSERTGKP